MEEGQIVDLYVSIHTFRRNTKGMLMLIHKHMLSRKWIDFILLVF